MRKPEIVTAVPLHEISIEEFDLVEAALIDPQWQFRTVAGIAEDTELPAERVESVLVNSYVARQSPLITTEGEPVFAHFKQKKNFREWMAVVRYILAS